MLETVRRKKLKAGLMVSFVRITVLSWAHSFANLALWMMMTYLTDVWKLNFSHAAAIVNIWNASAKALQIVFVLILGMLGNFRVLLVSGIAYAIGLGFLAMSTPPIIGSCSEYKPECIGYTQKVLFYTALALIAVGTAGHDVSQEPFMDEQTEHEVNNYKEEAVENQPPIEKKQVKNPPKIKEILYRRFAVVVIYIGGVVALYHIKPWSLKFGIPAICTFTATFVFTTVTCSKSYKSSNQGIQETKIRLSIRMIPVLLTFIICGLVLSAGNTYFLEQANNMNRKLGSIEVPTFALLLFYTFAISVFREIYICTAYTRSDTSRADMEKKGEDPILKKKQVRKYAPPIGIGTAMTFLILCCITAAKIETQRLHTIRDHGLLDHKPEETAPMTVFKLFPQFLLLAAFAGIFDKSAADFFIGYGLPTLSYIYITGMLGLGKMSSVLLVYVVGKVSEKGGKPNWFQESLSKSRLDKYYWTLAALTTVNFILYIAVACYCYSYEKVEAGDEEVVVEEEE